MADQQSIKNQQELNKLRKEEEVTAKSIKEVREKDVQAAVELLITQRSIVYELRDALGIRTRIAEEDRGIFNLSRQVASQMSQSNSELRETQSLQTAIRKETKLRYQTEIEIATLTEKMGGTSRTNLDLARKLADAQDAVNIEKAKTDKIERQVALAGSKASKELLKQEKEQRNILASKENALSVIYGQTDQETQILAALLAQLAALDELSEERKGGLEDERKINSALGITGALLDNLNKVGIRAFGGIGLNLAAFGVELSKAKDAADATAKKLALTKAGEGISNLQKRFRTMRATFPGIRRAVKEAFNDPLTIALTLISKLGGALRTSFLELDKAVTETARIIGNTNAVELARSLKTANGELVTVKDGLKIVAALSEQTQLNIASTFSPKTLSQAAELVTLFGLTEKEAASLAQLTALNGVELNTNREQLFKSVDNFNKLNRSAVSGGAVLRGVANTSNAIRLSLGGSVEELVNAQAQASRLGLDLEKLDQIADSLLDFESSIEAELQAQLLTGKEINLSKARELALSNDLAGVGNELFNNAADLREFAEMDRIDQKAYAQALGLTREEFAKMVFERGKALNLSDQDLQKALNLEESEYQRLELQVAFQKSIQKLLEVMTPVLEKMAGMTDLLVTSVTTAGALYGIFKGIQTVQGIITGLKVAEVAATKGAIVAERFLNFQRLTGVGRLAAQAVAYTIMNPVKAGIGAAAAIGIGGLIYSQIKDGMIDPEGGLMVSGPKGMFQLDKNDYVIAGTQLGAPADNNTGISVDILSRKLDTLIEATRARGNVYLDNRIVGSINEKQVIGATNFT